MADRQVKVTLSLDASQFVSATGQASKALGKFGTTGTAVSKASKATKDSVDQTGSALSNFASRAVNSAGDGLVSFAKKAVVGVVGFQALKAAATSTGRAGMDFQTNLNQLQAVAHASGAQMVEVGAKARALGNDMDLPAASASDAAQAMLELTKGNLSVDESMSAAKGTLMLAAAAQVSGAQAAEIQANALNAFALKGADAGHVADVLANTANAATGEITDFAAGMQQSAAVAHSFGIGIEDTSTVLGLFANAGIQGSDAGTSFKTMLTSLASPTNQQRAAMEKLNLTVYDAQGNFVGMRSITEQLAAAKGRLTQADFNQAASTVFGSDAIRGANILADGGVTAFDAMAQSVTRAGGAAEVAAANTKGLQGALGLVQNAAQDAQLQLFDGLSPALEGVTRQFADDIPRMVETAMPSLISIGQSITGLITKLEPLIPKLVDALAPAFSVVASTAGLVVQILTPVIALAGGVLNVVAKIPAPVLLAAAAFATWAKFGPAILTFLRSIPARARAAGAAMSTAFGPVGIAITAVTLGLSLLAAANDDAAQSEGNHKTAVEGLSDALRESNGVVNESVRAAAVAALKQAEWGDSSNDLTTYASNLGVSLRDLVDGMLGVAGTSDQLEAAYQRQRAALVAMIEAGKHGRSQTQQSKDAADTLKILDEQHAAYQAQVGVIGEAAAAARNYQDAVRDTVPAGSLAVGTLALLHDGYDGAAAAADAAAGATKDAGDNADDAAKKLSPMAQALQDIKDAGSAADTQLQLFLGTLQSMESGSIATEGLVRRADAALRDLGNTYRDYQKSLDATKQAEDDLATAKEEGRKDNESDAEFNRRIAGLTRDVADAKNAEKDATDKQFAANQQYADSAKEVVANTLLTNLANKGLTGSIEAATAEMQKRRDQFLQEQRDMGKSAAEATKLANQYGLIPGDVKTNFEALVADAKAKGQDLYKVYDATTGTWTGVFLTAGDAQARRNAGDTLAKYDPLSGTWTAVVAADPSQARSGVATANSYLDSFDGRVATATIRIQRIVSGNGAAGLSMFEADGGVVKYYAAGAVESHVAQIAPAGAWRVWAEDETGGETYVPHALSKRPRSEAIMSETAKIFGGQYIPASALRNAGGSFYGRQVAASSAGTVNIGDIRVFIGNKEITDIVGVEIGGVVRDLRHQSQLASAQGR